MTRIIRQDHYPDEFRCEPPTQTLKTILCCIGGECTDLYTTGFDCLDQGGTFEEHEKFQIHDNGMRFIFSLVDYAANTFNAMPNLIDALQYRNENGSLPIWADQNDLNSWLHICNFTLNNNLLEAELRPAPKGILVGYTNYEEPGNKIYKFLIRKPFSVVGLNGKRKKLESVLDWTPVIWNQPEPINGSVYDNPTLKHYAEILNEGNYISYGLNGTNDLDKIKNPLDDFRDIYWHDYYIIDTGIGPTAVPNIEMYINGKKVVVPITGHIGKYNDIYYALLKNGDWQQITFGENKNCGDMINCTPAPSDTPSPSPSPVSRAFTVTCPITVDLQEKTDIVITNITNSGVISAGLDSYFYIGTPDYSGCASISALNPYLPDFEASPFLIGIYPAASVSPFTPYPSGEASCLSDHPCPS